MLVSFSLSKSCHNVLACRPRVSLHPFSCGEWAGWLLIKRVFVAAAAFPARKTGSSSPAPFSCLVRSFCDARVTYRGVFLYTQASAAAQTTCPSPQPNTPRGGQPPTRSFSLLKTTLHLTTARSSRTTPPRRVVDDTQPPFALAGQ